MSWRKCKRVSVALTRDQLVALKEVVAAGEYATTSEIVREALRDWQHKSRLRQEEIKRFGQIWDEGVASGDAGRVDFAELRTEARRRLEAARKG